MLSNISEKSLQVGVANVLFHILFMRIIVEDLIYTTFQVGCPKVFAHASNYRIMNFELVE